jgi:hypothetical protein
MAQELLVVKVVELVLWMVLISLQEDKVAVTVRDNLLLVHLKELVRDKARAKHLIMDQVQLEKVQAQVRQIHKEMELLPQRDKVKEVVRLMIKVHQPEAQEVEAHKLVLVKVDLQMHLVKVKAVDKQIMVQMEIKLQLEVLVEELQIVKERVHQHKDKARVKDQQQLITDKLV